MEYINGEFYMAGCREDDPSCIHNVEELAKVIKKIGFLPLFSNEIPGFSVEERTTISGWWSDDPENDPWVWRQILSNHPDIAYGKFFNKKAGYVSKKWFPVFANYRRNGYDFEALVGDELASHRAQKIMNALELDDELRGLELLSYELKEKAGFGKSGERNYEGIITDLQMQTFLLMSDFRQKVNKKGQAYGWHIAAYETPETKWSYDFIAEGYKESPEESWKRIVKQIRKICPDADEEQIYKTVGIRHPGEAKRKKPKKKDKAYPENLITALGIPKDYWGGECRELTDDQMEGLSDAIDSLPEALRMVIQVKYEDHMSYQEIADLYRQTKDRIVRVHNKAIRMLKKENRMPYILYGYSGWQMMQLEEKKQRKASVEEAADAVCRELGIKESETILIADMDLSARSRNALEVKGIHTLRDFLVMAIENPKWQERTRNFGAGSLAELQKALETYGIKLTEKGSFEMME